jgi:hypothetical protein
VLGRVVVAVVETTKVEGAGPAPATPPIAVGPGVRTGPGVPGPPPILRAFPRLPKAT